MARQRRPRKLLVDFLKTVCTDDDWLKKFIRNPIQCMDEFGLDAQQKALLKSKNPRKIRQAMMKEDVHGMFGHLVAFVFVTMNGSP